MVRMESFPFDSKADGYDADGYPVYDRAVGASMLRATFEKFFADGVFPTPGTALNIGKADTGLAVTVQPGIAIINGAMGGIEGDDPITLTLDTAAPQGNVCYGIMLRYDNTDDARSLYFNVVKGDSAATPTPPAPDQTSPEVFELRLGYVTVPSNAIDLSEATITNEKGLEVCPYAAPFEEIDMSTVTADAMASATAALASLQSYIETNMDFIDSAIDGTTAGNLQNQINSLKQQLDAFDLSGSVDNETIEFTQKLGEASKLLRVKEGGLQTVHYADGSVTYAKLSDDVKQAISKPKVGKDISAYSWDELIELAQDPTTAAEIDYLIGQSRSINIAGYGNVDFQLIGINHDDLATGSGKAAMTFCAVSVVVKQRMNASDDTTGGWAASEMEEWMNSTLYNAFPDYLKEHIVEVKKKYKNGESGSVQAVNNRLWLLSEKELTNSTSCGDEGEIYEYWSQNNNNNARIKLDSARKAADWWERSVWSSASFRCVSADGRLVNFRPTSTYGVVPCFSIN